MPGTAETRKGAAKSHTYIRQSVGCPAATALSLFIRDLCPDARLEVSFVRYEDEDAHIWASLPPTLAADEREALANRLAERSLDILLKDGILILAGIEEFDEMREAEGERAAGT